MYHVSRRIAWHELLLRLSIKWSRNAWYCGENLWAAVPFNNKEGWDSWDCTKEIYMLYQIHAERLGQQTIIYRWQFLAIKSSVDLMKHLQEDYSTLFNFMLIVFPPLKKRYEPPAPPPHPARNTLGLSCVVWRSYFIVRISKKLSLSFSKSLWTIGV